MLKFKKNVEILKNVKILATPYELWKIKSEDEIEFVISLSYSQSKCENGNISCFSGWNIGFLSPSYVTAPPSPSRKNGDFWPLLTNYTK